jgi:hypothetical protein
MIITRGYGKGGTTAVEVPTGTGGGGMGGSVITHTEFIDRPTPVIIIKNIEEEIKDKEITVVSVEEIIII